MAERNYDFTEIKTRIIIRNDSAENWAGSEVILEKGEPAIEYDAVNKTAKIKFGDGTSTFSELPFSTLTPSEVSSLINAVESGESSKVTTVTTSGDGNAVTGGSISDDGTTLTLTKDKKFLSYTGGELPDYLISSNTTTYTDSGHGGTKTYDRYHISMMGMYYDSGEDHQYSTSINPTTTFNTETSFRYPVTVETPTEDQHAATKKYVDDLVDGYELKGNINSRTDVEDLYVYNPPFVTERLFKKGDMYEIKSNHIYIPSQISAESNTDGFYVNKGDLIFAVSDMGFIHISSSTLYIRGTIGTNGTFNNFESMYDTTGPTIIDTEYESGDIFSIKSDLTLPEEISFNGQEIALKYGDVILALPDSKFIKINDSDTITSIKIADIGDIINVSTIARSGEIILGTTAGKDASTTVTDTDNLIPTSKAVKTYVDDSVSSISTDSLIDGENILILNGGSATE